MTMIKKLTILTTAAAVSATLASVTQVSAAEQKWKMAASWGGGPLMEIGAKAFANKAKFLTDGS